MPWLASWPLNHLPNAAWPSSSYSWSWVRKERPWNGFREGCHRLPRCLITCGVTGCERKTDHSQYAKKELPSTFQGYNWSVGGLENGLPALGSEGAEGLEPTDSQPQQHLGLLLLKVPVQSRSDFELSQWLSWITWLFSRLNLNCKCGFSVGGPLCLLVSGHFCWAVLFQKAVTNLERGKRYFICPSKSCFADWIYFSFGLKVPKPDIPGERIAQFFGELLWTVQTTSRKQCLWSLCDRPTISLACQQSHVLSFWFIFQRPKKPPPPSAPVIKQGAGNVLPFWTQRASFCVYLQHPQ